MPVNSLYRTPDSVMNALSGPQGPLGMNPNVNRLSLLPRYSQREGLVAPQWLYDLARAAEAPGNALMGHQTSPEEALNFAGNVAGAGLGSSAMMRNPAPGPGKTLAMAVKNGPSWPEGAKPADVSRLAAKADKFLYHSDVADNVDNLHYGIEPTNEGPWIREVAEGAVDDPDELLSNSTPLAWFSDAPEWVRVKVARALGKHVRDVTDEDVERIGHLALINKKDQYLKDIWRLGPEGLDNGPYSTVTNIKGKPVKAYETGMYGDGMEPFGTEINEWVATKPVDPFVQLTGKDLMEFLRLVGTNGSKVK